MSTRSAQFTNVLELMGLWRQAADVRTAEQLNLPTPQLNGPQSETVVVPATDALAS